MRTGLNSPDGASFFVSTVSVGVGALGQMDRRRRFPQTEELDCFLKLRGHIMQAEAEERSIIGCWGVSV